MVAALVWAHAVGGAETVAEPAGIVVTALKERRVVIFSYKGHERVVEPHALGKGTDEKPVLLAWQLRGGSQSEPPPGWRVFVMAEISGLKATDETFAKPRPDFGTQKGGRGLKKIEQEVVTE